MGDKGQIKRKQKELKKLEKEHSFLFAHIASLEMEQGQYKAAKKRLEQGLDQNPDYTTARILLAECLSALSKSDEALRQWKIAHEKEPMNQKALAGYISELAVAENPEALRRALFDLYRIDPLNEENQRRLHRQLLTRVKKENPEISAWPADWHPADFTYAGAFSQRVANDLGLTKSRQPLPEGFSPKLDLTAVNEIVKQVAMETEPPEPDENITVATEAVEQEIKEADAEAVVREPETIEKTEEEKSSAFPESSTPEELEYDESGLATIFNGDSEDDSETVHVSSVSLDDQVEEVDDPGEITEEITQTPEDTDDDDITGELESLDILESLEPEVEQETTNTDSPVEEVPETAEIEPIEEDEPVTDNVQTEPVEAEPGVESVADEAEGEADESDFLSTLIDDQDEENETEAAIDESLEQGEGSGISEETSDQVQDEAAKVAVEGADSEEEIPPLQKEVMDIEKALSEIINEESGFSSAEELVDKFVEEEEAKQKKKESAEIAKNEEVDADSEQVETSESVEEISLSEILANLDVETEELIDAPEILDKLKGDAFLLVPQPVIPDEDEVEEEAETDGGEVDYELNDNDKEELKQIFAADEPSGDITQEDNGNVQGAIESLKAQYRSTTVESVEEETVSQEIEVESVEPEPDTTEGGALSQADIEALKAEPAGTVEEEVKEPAPPAEETGGTLSQSDIEALKAESAGTVTEEVKEPVPPAEETGGSLSQADIEALKAETSGTVTEEVKESVLPAEETGGSLSQADIEALKAETSAKSREEPVEDKPVTEEPGGSLSQTDIEALKAEALEKDVEESKPVDKPEPARKAGKGLDQDDINNLQAELSDLASIEDSVTQETPEFETVADTESVIDSAQITDEDAEEIRGPVTKTFANVLLQQGQAGLAKKVCEKLLDKNPNDPEVIAILNEAEKQIAEQENEE